MSRLSKFADCTTRYKRFSAPQLRTACKKRKLLVPSRAGKQVLVGLLVDSEEQSISSFNSVGGRTTQEGAVVGRIDTGSHTKKRCNSGDARDDSNERNKKKKR